MPVLRAPDSIDAAQHILALAQETDNALTPMQLLKLTYISHGWMLGLRSEPLVSDDVEAWQYGPVFPHLYRCLRDYGSNPVPNVERVRHMNVRPREFGEDAKSIMDQVVRLYGSYTGLQLSDITHQPGSPWHDTWERHGKSAVIPQDLIQDHYRELSTHAVADGR